MREIGQTDTLLAGRDSGYDFGLRPNCLTKKEEHGAGGEGSTEDGD